MAEQPPGAAPPFDADAADVRLVTNLEEFATAPFAQQFDLFAGAMSPPPLRLLVSGNAGTAVPPDHYFRRQLPPVALYAVPGHTLGGAGLLLGPDRSLFGKEDCLPQALRERLAQRGPDPAWLGALLAPDAAVLDLPAPCVVPLHPEPSYPEFLVDVLPRLYLFAALQSLGRRFPIALSRGTPEWMRRIVALYASEAETVWYDPAREVVRAPMFIVPAMTNVDHYLHPALNLVAADLAARAGAAAVPAASGARLYLSYRAFGDGRLSRLDNEPELAAMLAGMGFRTLEPWRMTLPAQLAAYRDAACIVSEHSAAACNALFAPHGAKVAVIGQAETVLRRICALRGHTLGLIEPDGGAPADAGGRVRVAPERFRALMTRVIDLRLSAAVGPEGQAVPA